jgi:hypothetical protein
MFSFRSEHFLVAVSQTNVYYAEHPAHPSRACVYDSIGIQQSETGNVETMDCCAVISYICSLSVLCYLVNVET